VDEQEIWQRNLFALIEARRHTIARLFTAATRNFRLRCGNQIAIAADRRSKDVGAEEPRAECDEARAEQVLE
jgi:hypothetical protein